MVEIRTERLLLRPASLSDAPSFHRILSNPDATRFWSTLPHSDLSTTEGWVSAMATIRPSEGEDFVIERAGEVIGKAGFYRFPEIGFILDPGAWGHGYAAEALRPLLDRAFRIHRLAEVKADVDPGNVRCLRLLSNLGFEEVRRAART